MLKNERGITLIVLVITVIIMIILVGVGITAGGNSLSEVKLQNFSYELQQIQGRVDSIYEKMNTENNPSFVTLGTESMGHDIDEYDEAMDVLYKVRGINYRTALKTNENLYYNKLETYYRYFSKSDLKNILDIKEPSMDVIINFKTKEVISIQGLQYKEKTLYRLNEVSGFYTSTKS